MSVFLLCGGLLCGSVFAKPRKKSVPQLSLEVVVYDQAHMPRAVLDSAGAETIRILQVAGINVSWTICSMEMAADPESCRLDADAKLPLVLNVLPRATGASAVEVCGRASLGEDGFGKYADLFLDHIEQLQKLHGIDLRVLLGAAAAHEIGHLLLGSGAHSSIGIMKPLWNSEDLRQVGMGAVVFTSEQAQLLYRRLSSPEMRGLRSLAASSQSREGFR